ncbi:MAG TPA: hypothetical protein VGK18_02845 [Propionicimonas sp.]|jgi:hypothetical protein|uniref:hypothetical protein n=1 Tax=Propionicimonas sp. TaxID=1955623 RepID=UPI002F3EC06D
MTDVADPYPAEENSDLYTQTVKAPGVESDAGTSLGDEDSPVTPAHDRQGGDQLEHGLGTAGGGSTHDATLEEGTSFGLGSDNTQDTPPVPEPDEPDPLRHGLGQADESNVE